LWGGDGHCPSVKNDPARGELADDKGGEKAPIIKRKGAIERKITAKEVGAVSDYFLGFRLEYNPLKTGTKGKLFKKMRKPRKQYRRPSVEMYGNGKLLAQEKDGEEAPRGD